MKLILMGCEYAGKRTLGVEISKWWHKKNNTEFNPPPSIDYHDHFTVPWVVHAIGHEHHKEESEKKILDLNPGLLEHFQRYQTDYHMQDGFVAKDADHWNIDWYYSDAVYAPLYYGFGRPGEYADRWEGVHHYEETVMDKMPDMVLVLVKATPEKIKERVIAGESLFPERHKGSLMKSEDIDYILERFQTLYDQSIIKNKFEIDTSSATVKDSISEFISNVEPIL